LSVNRKIITSFFIRVEVVRI